MQRSRIFFICLLILSFSSTKVLASESALSVSPAILEVIAKPNVKSISKVIIVNTTNFPLPIKGQVDSFILNSELPKSDNDTFNAAAWFTLDPADFILQPQEKKEVQITIRPPKDTEPGGHYATIYFQPLIPREVLSAESTTSLARVGVLSFLVVPGDIRENLEISNFKTNSFQAFGPINIDFDIHNSGNIHLLPIGQIEIKNITGKIVSTLTLGPNTILPGTTKEQTLTWKKRLLFGRYQSTLTINYGTNHEPQVSGPQYIWIVPWPLILGLVTLLTLLYKVFIVHIDRVLLAIRVLKGKDVQETQITSQSTSIKPRSHGRPYSSHARSRRSNRS